MRKILLFFLSMIFTIASIQAQEIMRSTTGVAGTTSTLNQGSKTLVVQQSIGQGSAIGTFSSGAIMLRQGYIQPPSIKTSIIEEDSNLLASVYPNPFTDAVNISFSEEVSGDLDIVIFDMLGRKVHDQRTRAAQELTVNLQSLSSAQYIMVVSAGNKQFKANLIKK